MRNAQKLIFVFVVMIIACINVGCGKKYTVKYISDNEIVKEIEVKKIPDGKYINLLDDSEIIVKDSKITAYSPMILKRA